MAELPGGKSEGAYTEILKARRARLEEALSAASMVASETKPEIAAENHTLARETGLPPEVVAQDPEAVKMKRRADSWALLGSKNPSVAKWLLTADNAQLAQNDIKPIGALTSLFDTMRAVPEGLIGQTFGSGTSGVGRVHGILDRNLPESVKQGADALLGTTGAGMVSKLFGGPSASDLYAKVSPGLQSLGKTLEDVGRAIGPPEERRTWAAEVGAGLGQIFGYVLAGPTSPVLMFGQGVEIMGDRVDAYEKENGPLGNLQLSKALPGQEPKEGDIIDSGIPMGDVAMLGGGVVTAVSEKLSMNWLLRKLPQGVRATLMTRLGDIASSAGGEAVQETVENIMHNVVAKLAFDPNAELFNWDEILQESGTAAASAAIFRALLGVKRGRSASDQAATDINTLDQMVEQSRIAQLRTLAPDRFEELLRQMQANGQQNIYMPAEEFQRYWQTAQQNDQTLAKTMNVPLDDYLTALATKGEIGVPLDKYLSMMPDSHDTLREKIRFRPGGLTIEEANDPKLVEERANVVAARFMKSATSIERAARQEIYDDVLEQFRNTGRFGESDIEAYASLFSTIMVTTAKRAGVDPVQLYRERGLKIMSSLPGPLANVAPQLDSMIERLKAGEVVSIEGEDDASLQLKYAMDTLAEEINRRNISLDLPTAQIRGMLTGDPRATSTEILGQLGPERSPTGELVLDGGPIEANKEWARLEGERVALLNEVGTESYPTEEQNARMDEILAEQKKYSAAEDARFATGKPVTVRAFHGSSSARIAEEGFRADVLGSNTKAPSARMGHFFAGRPETSSSTSYTGTTKKKYINEKPNSVFVQLNGHTKARLTDEVLRENGEDTSLFQWIYRMDSDIPPSVSRPAVKDLERKFSAAWNTLLDDNEMAARVYQKLYNKEIPPVKEAPSPVIYPARLHFNNPYVYDYKGESYRERSYASIIAKAKKAGHDGVILLNTYDGGPLDNIFVAFDDQQIEQRLYQSQPRADQTDTPEFANWSKGARLVRRDESQADYFKAGEPVVVEAIHGTTGDFEVFDPSRANIESDLGGGIYATNNPDDAGENYAGLGPDLTNKIELMSERIQQEEDINEAEARQIARQRFMQNEGLSMPVFIRFDNPIVLGGNNETFLDYTESYNEETDEYGEPEGPLVAFIEAFRYVANDERYEEHDPDQAISEIFENAIDKGGLTAREIIETLSSSRAMQSAIDLESDTGALASREIIHKAFEAAGYDGFIDQTVNAKFGNEKKIGKPMAGMDQGTVHYVAFKPTQVKSSVGNRGTFDPANPNILYQMENVLSGKEKVPTFSRLDDVVAWIADRAKSDRVVDPETDLMSSKGRAEAVDQIAKHTLLELKAWTKLKGDYRSFYGEDIEAHTNPLITEYVLEKYGRKPTKDEISLIHLLSAFGSGQSTPTVDTQHGLTVFDEWMKKGEVTGYSDKPKPVYKAFTKGESPKRVYIDSVTGEDTQVAAGNEPKFDHEKRAQVSKTYNVTGLARFMQIHKALGEDLHKTVTWLGTKHSFEDIQKVIGVDAAKKLKPHEYLDKNGQSFGVFALGNNPKLGSYILNRWGNFGTITKDMWVARTMSRYFDEANTGEPWLLTKVDLNKRKILEEAWNIVAKRLKVKPAEVQEMMWDAEKKIYARFGQTSEGAYSSSGVELALSRLRDQRARDGATDQEGTGKAGLAERFQQLFQSAFHGSPYRFSKFTLDHIGTGEGAQAFGYGLYFAGKKAIAEYYQNKLSDPEEIIDFQGGDESYVFTNNGWVGRDSGLPLEGEALVAAEAFREDPDSSASGSRMILESAIEEAEDGMILIADREFSVDDAKAALEIINEDLVQYRIGGGQLYEVDIPDDSEMLQWDKPLSEQPEKVREALEKLRGTHVAVDTALDKPNVTTGAGFYKTLSAALGDTNGEKASPALNDVGIPGISYPAESLSGGKGDSRNYVIFDDSTIEILNTFYQGSAQPRGLIRWTQDRQFTIELLENANLSTFLHETGHFFLEVMGDLAADPNVEQGIKDDYAKILNWFGAYANSGGALNEIEATTREIKARLSAATPGTDQHKELANALAIHEAALATARNGGPRFMQEVAETFGGNVQDQRIRGVLVTPFHEMFARGFEAYLHSGKAPSAEVAGIFTRFSAWLKTLYRNLTELNVNLTPEVVGVFDRMVASEEEIEMARGEMGYEAVFKNAQMAGWSKAKFDQYLKDIEETESAEEARLLSVLMSEVQREKSAWWKEQSAKVQKEVEKDVYSRPEYQVLAYLKNGTQADGSPLPDGMVAQKLDKAWLEARYGQAFLNKNLLRKRVYAVTDGVDPEVVADMFGYDSADAMIDAIVNAKDIDAVVRHETRQRMLAEHGDMLNDGSAAEEAMRAVHSDRRMQVFYSEYETLAKLAGETPMSVTGLRRAAEIVVAGQKVRNLTPTNYLRAERRAGKAALKAAGNGKMAEALLEKRNQLINAHLYDVARKANVEAEKIRNFVKRFEKTTVKQRLGLVGRLDAVQMILDQYDLRRISGKQIDRNKVRNDLFEAIKSGQIIAAPEIANKLLRDTGRTNWRDLTVAELRGLKDVLAQMDKEARAEYEVWVLGEKRKVDDAAGEMAAQVVGNGKLLVLPRGKETKEESAKRALSSLVSSWRRPGSLARVLDGEDWGAVTRQLIAPIRRAVTEKLEPMRVEAGLKIQEIYSRYYTKEELDKEMSERFFVKSLGVSLSKFDLLNLAQNWGSDGNREAIVKGEALGNPNFTEDGVMQAFQDHLTAKDWGFVQDSVDMINSYWGEIEAANKRRKGIAPKKVDALPFAVRTKDGEVVNVKGGYFPLKYDRGLEGKSRAHEIDENFQDLVAGRTASAMTKAGHNIERVGSGGRPVQMSINVWHNHIDHVIRDLALTDTVIWADKLIRHKDFRSAMIETGNTEVLNTLELWLKDVAGGELAPRGIESVSAFLRINFTLAKIGFNMNTMLLQVTGLPQTAVVVGRQWFAAGAREYAKNPRQAIRGAMEQSEFMRLRYELSSFNKDIQFVRDFIHGKVGDTSGKGGLAKALKIIERARIKPQWVEYAFLGIKYAQLQVDTLTWWAGYHKGVTLKQLSHSEAVQYADTVVENAQTSGMFSDRAGLERGTVRADVRQAELVKVWTTLGSYMLAKGNIASESFMRNDMKSVGGIGNFLLDMFLLFLPEFVLYSLLKGNEPDEDESWWWWLTKGSVEQMAATIPIVREIPSAAKGFSTGGVIGATVSDVGRVLNQTAQGELDLALIKAYVNLIGTATGLPAAQTNRAIDYAVREYQGEEANPMEIIVGKQAK